MEQYLSENPCSQVYLRVLRYPILYNLYTSKPIRTKLAAYADDICIYDQHKSVRFAHLAVQKTPQRDREVDRRMVHQHQC